MKPLRLVAAGVALALIALPPLRRALESGMAAHMLVQAPLLMLCGAALAHGLGPRTQERIARWNSHGLAGLFAFALGTALLMVPRLLDLAVADLRVDVAKAAVLLACGAALRLSWRPAGALVQGFFLGNVLPMMAAVGQLYQNSPLRLCNAYLLDDQARVGAVLVGATVAIGAIWFTALVSRMTRSQPPEPVPGEDIPEARGWV